MTRRETHHVAMRVGKDGVVDASDLRSEHATRVVPSVFLSDAGHGLHDLVFKPAVNELGDRATLVALDQPPDRVVGVADQDIVGGVQHLLQPIQAVVLESVSLSVVLLVAVAVNAEARSRAADHRRRDQSLVGLIGVGRPTVLGWSARNGR